MLHLVQMAQDFNALVRIWQEQQKNFEPRSITKFLNRFTKGTKSITPSHSRAIAQVSALAESILDRFDIRGVSLLANAHRHLMSNSTLFQAIAARLLRKNGRELKEGKIKDLCMLADAARIFHHSELLEAASEACTKKLKGAKPQELPPLALAFAKTSEAARRLGILQEHISRTQMLSKLTDWQFSDLAKVYADRDEFAHFEDELHMHIFSAITSWQTTDWDKAANISLDMARQKQYRMCELFFRRLQRELSTLSQHAAFENSMLATFLLMGDFAVAKACELKESPLEHANTETLICLYMQVKPDRPDLFTDEIELYFSEIGNTRLKKAEEAWEEERML